MSDYISLFWFLLISVWHIVGFGILKAYEDSSINYNSNDDSLFAYLNPFWLYENYNVNFFGAFLLMILFNLICPVITIIYWFCKFIKFICTVGRKK